MKKIIWMYWENKVGYTKPAYLDLCLETIKKNSGKYKVVLLNEKTVQEYLPNIRKDLDNLEEIMHKSEYIRANLIYKYGGVWFDSDFILLKEVDFDKYFKKFDFIGCGYRKGTPSLWFFGAKKGCDILRKWIDLMDEKLDKKLYYKPTFQEKTLKYTIKILDLTNIFKSKYLQNIRNKKQKEYSKEIYKRTNLGWIELGYRILWKIFNDYEYYHFKFKKFAPIEWKDWKLFFRKDIELKKIIKKDTLGFALYNKFMFEPLKNKTRKQILEDNNLLSKIFNFSLEMKKEKYNKYET